MPQQERVPELEEFYGLRIVDGCKLSDATYQTHVFICYGPGNKTNGNLSDVCLYYVKTQEPHPRPSCPHHPTGYMNSSGSIFRLPNGEHVRYCL